MNDVQDTAGDSVAVLGLGALGRRLAEAFLSAGHETGVWNRSVDRGGDLAALGARRAATVSDAISTARVVVVCVTDYVAVREVLAAGDDWDGRLVVNLSSGTPETARDVADQVRDVGGRYLDGAAMSGTKLVGSSDALFLYSGSTEGFSVHEPTLAALGSARFLGADAGMASLYDTAMFGMSWAALAGFYQAAAVASTEGVAAVDFAAVATRHMGFITALMVEHAEQIDAKWYPDDDGSVEVHAAAMDHVIHTSSARGVDVAGPMLARTLLGRSEARGHAGDGIASVYEALVATSGSDGAASRTIDQ